MAELVRVEVAHIAPEADGTATLTIPTSKTDQDGRGALAWLSRDTVRRVSAWREAAEIRSGPLFRRIAVIRTRPREATPIPDIPGYRWRLPAGTKLPASAKPVPASTTFIIGDKPLTPAAVRLIIKRTAQRAAEDHLVGLVGKDLDDAINSLSTHSLRVGLTQDLFASGEDAGPIAQALRWTSTSTALRYGRKLAPSSNASARMLGKLRE